MDHERETGPEAVFLADGIAPAASGVAGGALAGRRCSDLPVRVVLADDECLFRASLRQLLAVPPAVIKDVYGVDVGAGFDVIGEAGTGEDTVRVVRAVRPDLLLLDLSMPRMSGLDALRELEGQRDTLRTIILAGTIERPHLLAAVHMGVRGLLLKDATTEVMFEAIMCVMAGRCWLEQTLVTDLLDVLRPLIQTTNAAASPAGRLTPRERQVLALVAAGYPNKEIARVCSVSEQTIKHHLTRMFDKVGATSRVELAMLATRQGLVDSPDPVRDPAPSPAPPMLSAIPAMIAAPE